MLIVAGHFDIDPADQEPLGAGRAEAMKKTRAGSGCLGDAMTVDPLDPARVVLFERWADQESFDAHMAGVAEAPKSTGPTPKGFDVKIYDIEGERAFG